MADASGHLRAPDPTLDAMDAKWGVVSVEDGLPPTAHAMDPGPDCDPGDDFKREWARDARWFAVPCRVCFPEAPAPGCEYEFGKDGRHGFEYPVPALGWQVPEQEHTDD